MAKEVPRDLPITAFLLNTSVACSRQGWLCTVYVIARKMTSG